MTKPTIATLTAFLLLAGSMALATPEMGTKTAQKCAACHDKAGSKLLTSKGKFYELRGSLEGYDELIRSHRKCTSCHSKEPGSLRLTAKGEALKAKGESMHTLCSQVKPKEKE